MELKELLRISGLTQSQLADRLGIKQPSVSNWRNGIPLDRVPDLERITGVPREKIRPDFFGDAA